MEPFKRVRFRAACHGQNQIMTQISDRVHCQISCHVWRQVLVQVDNHVRLTVSSVIISIVRSGVM